MKINFFIYIQYIAKKNSFMTSNVYVNNNFISKRFIAKFILIRYFLVSFDECYKSLNF